ncbi:excinuclease ABC subunit A [Subtercola boreus]|uniref:UvrABC system protein A n=1 Tax=Subtercola boreus TaxID=120213 RepID=A0A3E0VN50_9MICO|nr:excinuclease ABC subunit UvrA [Subtercola boreus]RFA10843.1 excinuclease ABC subunit A [Subtercola boreus]TQL55575.1 excinuclease ABC subunit A [Subtercola boreus]
MSDVNGSPAGAGSGGVRVRGAREHNLQSIDVDIPRNALVAFTGVSGSGKSSLAFGTVYAEAQRRFFESVAPYARRLIDQVGVPDVDSIDGLPPAVALSQRRSGGTARSTVGSATTVANVVRMLFSRVGTYPVGAPMLFAEDFSANTVQGACPACHGLGRIYDVPEELMVPDDSLSIRERALAAWPTAWHGKQLQDSLISLGYDVDVPWRDLPADQRTWALYTDESPQVPIFRDLSPSEVRKAVASGAEPSYMSTFLGVKRYVLDTFASSKSARMREKAAGFMVSVLCPTCGGKRLRPDALAVTFEGADITEISSMPLDEVARLMEGILLPDWGTTRQTSHRPPAEDLPPEKRLAAQRLATDLLQRLSPITDLGLGYLTLDRTTSTLSSGELQRMRLATQVLSRLFGVVFVLDEPSAGLHPADTEALLGILRSLRDSGNSVFYVEHSLGVIREADWIIDIGPGAGTAGGTVIYSGEIDGLRDVQESVTRRYLFTESEPAPEPKRRRRSGDARLALTGVARNNLSDVSVSFPLGAFTAITGVSGSGKSTLLNHGIPDLLRADLASATEEVEGEAEPTSEDPLVSGAPVTTSGRASGPADRVRRIVQVTQKPIGRTPRSNVATYTGVFDQIRSRFAATPEARRRHYGASRFSFNLPSGRCPVCKGEGMIEVELLFLPTVHAPCTACAGTRYNDETLEIRLDGMTVADVLAMSVSRAREFFEGDADVVAHLDALLDVGLGYISLGQSATELSGGEAQRVKLASELRRAQRGDTLYLLDEPTSGLHPADSDRLIGHLQRLVDGGNTVIIVEHDMRVVAEADWVIDLGPGAGDAGGHIVAEGTPEDVSENPASRTAPYLRAALTPSRAGVSAGA